VAGYNDITKIFFFEAKRLTFPEPHKPVTAKKICVWQRSNRHFSSGDNTRARWWMPERSHAIKQSVTVHEKSRKAEPSNVQWKRAMKLIFSYSLFQTQVLWWWDSSSILPFLSHSSFSKCQHLRTQLLQWWVSSSILPFLSHSSLSKCQHLRTQLLWWWVSSSILPFLSHSSFSKCQHLQHFSKCQHFFDGGDSSSILPFLSYSSFSKCQHHSKTVINYDWQLPRVWWDCLNHCLPKIARFCYATVPHLHHLWKSHIQLRWCFSLQCNSNLIQAALRYLSLPFHIYLKTFQ